MSSPLLPSSKSRPRSPNNRRCRSPPMRPSLPMPPRRASATVVALYLVIAGAAADPCRAVVGLDVVGVVAAENEVIRRRTVRSSMPALPAMSRHRVARERRRRRGAPSIASAPPKPLITSAWFVPCNSSSPGRCLNDGHGLSFPYSHRPQTSRRLAVPYRRPLRRARAQRLHRWPIRAQVAGQTEGEVRWPSRSTRSHPGFRRGLGQLGDAANKGRAFAATEGIDPRTCSAPASRPTC